MEKEAAEEIDLIYEGITTPCVAWSISTTATEGIDLIYEGIPNRLFDVRRSTDVLYRQNPLCGVN